jgi:hypothetical protein
LRIVYRLWAGDFKIAPLTPPQDRIYYEFFFQTVNNTLTIPLKRASLIILLLGIGESKGWTQIYDAARDFSIKNNPSGVWSYGYKETLGDTFKRFDLVSNRGGPLSFWIFNNQVIEPSVVKNFSSVPTKACPNCDFTVDPGQLVFHPGGAGELSIVRWTCPISGPYEATASFLGVGHVSTVTIHLFANGQEIFGSNLMTNGQSSTFSKQLFLVEGDVLDAAVGAGTDGHYGDATGLQFFIDSFVSGGPSASADARVVNGFLVDVIVTAGGSGYVDPPQVRFVGHGTGAVAEATIENGAVKSIKVIAAGSGYDESTKVFIEPPPKLPSLSIRVQTVRVALSVTAGRHYLLESSTDLKNWASASDFVADTNIITKDFDVFETGRFFRITEIPR